MRWHCPPDTGFETRALAVWGRARHLLVTEAPHNTEFYEWMVKRHFTFLLLSNRRDRELNPNSSVKGSGANHYPRAPALWIALARHNFKWQKFKLNSVKRSDVTGNRFQWMGTRWKQSYIRPPLPYFIVLASSVTTMEVKAIEFHRIAHKALRIKVYNIT